MATVTMVRGTLLDTTPDGKRHALADLRSIGERTCLPLHDRLSLVRIVGDASVCLAGSADHNQDDGSVVTRPREKITNGSCSSAVIPWTGSCAPTQRVRGRTRIALSYLQADG